MSSMIITVETPYITRTVTQKKSFIPALGLFLASHLTSEKTRARREEVDAFSSDFSVFAKKFLRDIQGVRQTKIACNKVVTYSECTMLARGILVGNLMGSIARAKFLVIQP